MSGNRPFDNRTATLAAGVSLAIMPPRDCKAVVIFSEASTTAYFYSELDDDTTAIPISAGWNQPIVLNSGSGFRYQETAFWLKCSVAATMYLLWN